MFIERLIQKRTAVRLGGCGEVRPALALICAEGKMPFGTAGRMPSVLFFETTSTKS
jgi:hypothetical protein